MKQIHKKTEEFEEADNRYARKMRELINTHNDHMKTIKEIEELGLGFAIDYWRIEEILKKEPSELTESDYNYLIEAFNKALEKDLSGEGNPKELKNVSKFMELAYKLSKDMKFDGLISYETTQVDFKLSETFIELTKRLKEKLNKFIIENKDLLLNINDIENKEKREKLLMYINALSLMNGIVTYGSEFYSVADINKYKDFLKITMTEINAGEFVFNVNLTTGNNHKFEPSFVITGWTGNLPTIMREQLSEVLKEMKKEGITEVTISIAEDIRGGLIGSIPYVGSALDSALNINEILKALNEYNTQLDIVINLNDLSLQLEVFSFKGSISISKEGAINLNAGFIDTKELATKLYVYKEKFGNMPSTADEFYKNYLKYKQDLDGEVKKLYGNIYIDNIGDFSPEKQKELEEQQSAIEKIEKSFGWVNGDELTNKNIY